MRKNPEVKVRLLDLFLNSEFNKPKDREVSIWLANQVTEGAVRNARLESVRVRWCFTVKDNGTAKARIVLGFQNHRLGTIATASPTISGRGEGDSGT